MFPKIYENLSEVYQNELNLFRLNLYKNKTDENFIDWMGVILISKKVSWYPGSIVFWIKKVFVTVTLKRKQIPNYANFLTNFLVFFVFHFFQKHNNFSLFQKNFDDRGFDAADFKFLAPLYHLENSRILRLPKWQLSAPKPNVPMKQVSPPSDAHSEEIKLINSSVIFWLS